MAFSFRTDFQLLSSASPGSILTQLKADYLFVFVFFMVAMLFWVCLQKSNRLLREDPHPQMSLQVSMTVLSLVLASTQCYHFKRCRLG